MVAILPFTQNALLQNGTDGDCFSYWRQGALADILMLKYEYVGTGCYTSQ
jgi:hypothetical protein